MDDRIFAYEMKLRKAHVYLRQREDVMEESKKYQNLEQMDAGSDEEEIARLLEFIEQTARKSSVILSDVKPQEVKGDRMTKRYVVELNTESRLKELLTFIYTLQRSSQLLKIGRVQITPKEEGSLELRSFLQLTRVVVK